VTKTSVFQYRSASRFLLDRVVERQKADRRFSIRKWAKEMGFPSHSLLAMVLQGKRSLTLKQVPYLARGLGLSTPEKLFFQGLIQVENARTSEEKEWCETWLSELRPKTVANDYVREIDEYLTIANWIHPALLALSDTRESFRDADEAIRKLELDASNVEIRAAIERLSALGLLRKDSSGIYRATCERMTSRDDVANRGVREYHKQCATLAAERVEQQDVLEREFQSMAIAIPTSRLPLAKELIRKFRTQFSEAMSSEHCDQVYQMNLHFFRLTESPLKREVSKANEGADPTLEPLGVSHEEVLS
jgi:uncharacterized protein (TIGR02147 family)